MSTGTAFITGGAQGIGLGLARALAERGFPLALADINADALASAAAELSPLTQVQTHVLDVRDREAFARVADEVEDGLGPVTHLFNNAGVAGGTHVATMTYADWDWMLGINLGGVVNGIQTFVPRMIARQQGGYVVNTSSGAGLIATNAGFLYTTSKFAVVGLSETLQLELAPFGIGVSVLCPGPVATSIIDNTWNSGPLAEMAMTEELKASLEASKAFLASGVSTEHVAELVLDAIDRKQLHIFTDGHLREPLQDRHQTLLAALPD